MRDNLTLFMKYYLDFIMLGVSIYLVVDLFTGVENKCFTRHLYLADDGQSAHHDSKCLNWVYNMVKAAKYGRGWRNSAGCMHLQILSSMKTHLC